MTGQTGMKWYFALSESSIDRHNHGWRGIVRVAVASAIKNTSLKPNLIYDGRPNEFIEELVQLGVQTHYHRVSFYDTLVSREAAQPGYLPICSGAFLRVDLPVIEQEEEFVLYTDLDVIFTKEPNIRDIRPALFCAAPQASISDYDGDMNTGVLIINVKEMKKTYDEFCEFIKDNIRSGWPGCDQENYRRYYRGRWEKLPLELNWKPYWGENKDAAIIHWHGPKPSMVRQLQANDSLATNASWGSLYSLNRAAYGIYLRMWDGISSTLPRTYIGHVDRISRSVISGWLLDQDDPTRPADLDVFCGGKYIGELKNDVYRSDLDKLYTTKIGGFNFIIEQSLGLDLNLPLTIRSKGLIVKLKLNNQASESFYV